MHVLKAAVAMYGCNMTRNFAPETGGALALNKSSAYVAGSRLAYNG